MSNRPYFTLAVRFYDLDDNRVRVGRWSAEFGDYDKEVVEAELQDYRDHDKPAKDLKIVRSADNQAAINAAIGGLNSKK